MATIEERALDAAREAMLRWYESRTTVNGLITSVNKPDYIDGYVDGATDQRKIDIDKACEAFCIESKCRNRVNLVCRQTCEKLKCFREAMEGKA